MHKFCLILTMMLIFTSCTMINKYQKDFSRNEFRDLTSTLKIIVDEADLQSESELIGQKYNVELLGVAVQDVARVVYGTILNIPYVLDHTVYNQHEKIDISIKRKITFLELKNIVNQAIIEAGYVITENQGVIYLRRAKDDKDYKDNKSNLKKTLTVYQLQNVSADKVISRLKEFVDDVDIKLASVNEVDTIFYLVTEREKKKIQKMIRLLDYPEKQIYLELIILENNLEGILSYGLAGYLKQVSKALNLDIKLFGALTTGYQISLIKNTDIFNIILTFLETENYLTKISNPYLIIKSGTEASLIIGDQIPVLASTTIYDGSVSQNINYQSTGVSVIAKPAIIGSKVNIQLSIDISAGEINKLSTIQSPTISRRTIKTNIICNSSQGILIGGIYVAKSLRNNTGFPGPEIIKNIINENSFENQKTELLFFLKPVIINDENIKDLEKR